MMFGVENIQKDTEYSDPQVVDPKIQYRGEYNNQVSIKY